MDQSNGFTTIPYLIMVDADNLTRPRINAFLHAALVVLWKITDREDGDDSVLCPLIWAVYDALHAPTGEDGLQPVSGKGSLGESQTRLLAQLSELKMVEWDLEEESQDETHRVCLLKQEDPCVLIDKVLAEHAPVYPLLFRISVVGTWVCPTCRAAIEGIHTPHPVILKMSELDDVPDACPTTHFLKLWCAMVSECKASCHNAEHQQVCCRRCNHHSLHVTCL
jgi:hypothetical protein